MASVAVPVEVDVLYQQDDSGHASSYRQEPGSPPPSYGEVPGVVPFAKGGAAGPPPTYDEANNPNAPPPTYEALFGRVREVRKNSSGYLDFLKKLLVLILGTIGCTIMIGITVVIPVSMIIIGSSYLRDCPVEPYIPIYLVVGGVFGVIKNMFNFWTRCRRRQDANDETLKQNPVDTVISCFLFAWFISGCVWVYRVYEPNFDDPTTELYCNRTVYLFAFWLITSVFILLGLLSMCLCCLGVVSLTVQPD